ncbi:MAG: hypothetical protein U1E31_00980 [Rickettsiales bacterium]
MQSLEDKILNNSDKIKKEQLEAQKKELGMQVEKLNKFNDKLDNVSKTFKVLNDLNSKTKEYIENHKIFEISKKTRTREILDKLIKIAKRISKVSLLVSLAFHLAVLHVPLGLAIVLVINNDLVFKPLEYAVQKIFSDRAMPDKLNQDARPIHEDLTKIVQYSNEISSKINEINPTNTNEIESTKLNETNFINTNNESTKLNETNFINTNNESTKLNETNKHALLNSILKKRDKKKSNNNSQSL